jgi:hypothetical protein
LSTFLVAQLADAIVVGTDSRSTLVIDYTRKTRGPDTCKIHKCGTSKYFVIATNQLINTKTGIDFFQLAMRTCSAGGNPNAYADSFETQAINAANRILKEDKQTTVVSVAFFGYERGPYFFSRSIRVSPFENYRQPVDCPRGSSLWNAGGYHEVIDRLAPQIFKKHRLEDAVTLLLKKEIEADKTGEIGGPIAVLRLDKAGEHWIWHGVCH